MPLCAFAQSVDIINAAPDNQINNSSTDNSIVPDNNSINSDTSTGDVDNAIENLGFTEAEDDFIPTAEIVDLDEDSSDGNDDADPYNDGTVTYEEGAIGADQKLPNPDYEITSIHIVGNTQTSPSRIMKLMALSIGDRITLDELESARIRLAVSGAFESVEIRLKPGRASGTIDITVEVAERSKLQINNYWLGSSQKSPFWMGVDATWLAPFSMPHRMNFAFAATTTSDYSLYLSYLMPSVAQLPLSLMFSVYSSKSHEEVFGEQKNVYENSFILQEFPHLDNLYYSRHGLSAGIGFSPNEYFRFMFRVQYDYLHQSHDNEAIDSVLNKFLHHGSSHAPSASLVAMFDNRSGRNMPTSGHVALLAVSGTAESAISDYEYIRLSFFHQSNFPVHPNHILRIQSNAGLIYGNAPFIEKFFYNDYYALAPARFLRLNPSSRGAYDIFGTGASSLSYEDYLVNLAFTYAYQPIPRRIELFVTLAGIYADSFEKYPIAVGIKPRKQRGDFPVDMSFNAGVQFETPYGQFSLTLAHIFNFIRE